MSDVTTVDAVDVTSEGEEASSPENPNISCNRCGTLTTWNPYCPSCGAYLEFSGTPAWHPDEQLSTIPPVTAAPAADASADPSDASDPSATTDAAEYAPTAPVDAASAAPESAHDSEVRRLLTGLFHHGEHDLDSAEKDLEHDAEKTKADIEGDLHPQEHGVKPWWASWGETPPVVDDVDGVDEVPAAKVMASSGITPDPTDSESVVFESRRLVPALPIVEPGPELPGLPLDETQRTRAMGAEELDADGETCPRCELKNPAGRQYCDWCGTPLPNVMLGPESDAYNPYGIKSSGTVEVSSAPRRSYAVKITLLLVLLAALIWGVWYFFFGPKSEQTITAIKVVAQEFTEWLAPSIGVQVNITNVTASSSLQGTSPLALKTVSSRDFWASAPMTLYGAGTTVTFTFDKSYEIDRVVFYPGIQNQTFDVNALGTPRVVTIDVGNGKATQEHINLVTSNNDYEQVIKIPTVITDKVTITFDEVYPPRYPDPSGSTIGEVSASAIAFLQVPSATTVNPLATPSASPSSSASPSASGSVSPSASSSASSSSASPSPSSSSTKKSSSASPSPQKSTKSSPKPSVSPSPKPSASPTPKPSASPTSAASAAASASGSPTQ